MGATCTHAEVTMPTSDAERLSPRLLARMVGVLGLFGIATGAFDIGYVQNALVVAGDIPATLHNLQAHETLFRLGFSAHLLELVANVVGEILGFVLLRRVNGIVAAISLCCGMVGVAIEAVDLLGAYVPLLLATGGPALNALGPEQVHALARLAEQWQQAGLLLSWVFYGVDEIATGFLLYRSGFVPRLLGVLLGIAGLSYFMHGLLSFLAPSLDAYVGPYIPLLCLPGEGLSNLCLAVVGVNVAEGR